MARRLARVDSQTGLGNRRAFDEALTVAVAGAARDDEPLSVGLVDIDDLRRVNDGWGHLEGDRCLREVALAIERSLRSSDRCFRWGGDEFVVLLPGSDLAAADDVMSRMAANVSADCSAPDGTQHHADLGSIRAAGRLERRGCARSRRRGADGAQDGETALKRGGQVLLRASCPIARPDPFAV